MGRTITRKRYIRVMYTKFKTTCFDHNIVLLVPKKKVFTSYVSNGTSCYCSLSSKGSYRITFGGEMIGKELNLPNDFDITKAKTKYEITNRFIRAIYYHEVGHLKFTALGNDTIIRYKEPKYVGALLNLFNILEDPIIERYCMSKVYPYTKKYFVLLEKILYNDEAMSKYSDTKDYNAFCNFLLLKLRRGKEFIGTNEFADANPDYLGYVKSVMSECNGDLRIEKTITFFEWLIEKGMKMPANEPHESLPFSSDGEKSTDSTGSSGASSDVDESFGSGSSGKPSDTSSSSGSSSGKTKPEEKKEDPKTADEIKDEEEKKSEEDDSSTDEKGKSEDDKDKSEEEGEGDEGEKFDPDMDPSTTDEELEESFVEALSSPDYGHEFYNVRDYFIPSSKTDEYIESLLEKNSSLATEVAGCIKSFKIRTRPRYIEGYPSGKLHIPSVINGKPVNIFQRKEAKGLQTDLSVYLMIDNSGSMGSNKSRVACEAAFTLAMACNQAHIPCAISMFTADFDGVGATCYTYRLKQFKEEFGNIKSYIGVCDHSILQTYTYDSSLPTFAGNTDEINLFNVWKEYSKESYRDKLLIVLSDGRTCGSTENLRQLIKEIEKEMVVIGIGALSSAPESIYENNKIFNNLSELQQLPEFMSNVLFNLVKGNKIK